MSENIFNVDLDDFEDKVLKASNEKPILVDFWADWCGPCHGLAPHLKRIIDEYNGELQLGKVEVDEDENMKLAGRYGLRGFPTVILFHKKEEVARFSGAKNSSWIQQWLDENWPL